MKANELLALIDRYCKNKGIHNNNYDYSRSNDLRYLIDKYNINGLELIIRLNIDYVTVAPIDVFGNDTTVYERISLTKLIRNDLLSELLK
jgi:hypothetical protein